MKYLVLLGDGMADYRLDELGGRSPLEAARKPAMDALASAGEMGMVRTVPQGLAPGSDVANLSVMGYDPQKHYSGRSPLEAVSIGVTLDEADVTYRANTVTLSDDEPYENKIMLDYSADEITSQEGAQLIASVSAALATDAIRFYAGTSYRNLMVMRGGSTACTLTPPHDISGKSIAPYLPAGEGGAHMLELMKKSYDILKNHPVNRARAARGLRRANSLWFWGQGTKPSLPGFYDLYGQSGAVISAVDLLKGIGICAGLEIICVEGATGTVHTNFMGKAKAAVDALLGGKDFVYLHFEAADECGHRGEVENKVLSIEKIDGALSYIMQRLDGANEPYAILLLPDHPTPLSIRTHTAEPVPYVIYRSGAQRQRQARRYSEYEAQKTGIFKESGCALMQTFLQGARTLV